MTMQSSQVQRYRPELDGLRAVAVIAVMVFHAGLPQLSGGYLGVDIFFVISGYLITGIVAANDGAISLKAFYIRRIRRLIPALLLVFALVTPFAYAFLLPDGLENYGQSLFASAIMANNVLLYATGGYWDISAEFKPLMHTWSLGVEEQFYLLLVPMLLWSVRTGSQRRLGHVLLAVAAASLLLAAGLQDRNPSLDFLSLPSRAWELALGGLVALARRRQSPIVAAIGLAMAVLPMVLYGDEQSMPGFGTLIPAGGTALFIWSAVSHEGVGRVLSMPIPVRIGLISYSAYLLHQPLFAFIRVTSFFEPAPWQLVVAIPVVLVAAQASWWWVEQPCRNSRRIGDRLLLSTCTAGFLLAIVAGLAAHFSAGFVSRWPELAGVSRSGNIAYVDSVRRLSGTQLDPRNRRDNVIVIGNSQARDFVNMGLESGHLRTSQVRYVETGPCSPKLPLPPTDTARSADWVVMSLGLDDGSAACLLSWGRQFGTAGVSHFVILGPKQFGYSDAAVMRVAPPARYRLRLHPRNVEISANAAARAIVPDKQYLDLLALIDDDLGRVPVLTPDRRFISQDGRHLTPAGAGWLGNLVFAQPQLRDLQRSRAIPR